jgi:hypothetical protein
VIVVDEFGSPRWIELVFARGDAKRLAEYLHKTELPDPFVIRHIFRLLVDDNHGQHLSRRLEVHYRDRHRPKTPLADKLAECLEALREYLKTGADPDRKLLEIADMLDPGGEPQTDFQIKFCRRRKRAGNPSTPLRSVLSTLYREAGDKRQRTEAALTKQIKRPRSSVWKTKTDADKIRKDTKENYRKSKNKGFWVK